MPMAGIACSLPTIAENRMITIGLLCTQLIASACGTCPEMTPLDPTHPASPHAIEGKLHTELLAIDSEESEEVQSTEPQQNHSHHHHTSGMHHK